MIISYSGREISARTAPMILQCYEFAKEGRSLYVDLPGGELTFSYRSLIDEGWSILTTEGPSEAVLCLFSAERWLDSRLGATSLSRVCAQSKALDILLATPSTSWLDKRVRRVRDIDASCSCLGEEVKVRYINLQTGEHYKRNLLLEEAKVLAAGSLLQSLTGTERTYGRPKNENQRNLLLNPR